MNRPLLAITMGDPCGIGPEIVLRLVAEAVPEARLLVLGDRRALEREQGHVPGVPVPPVVDCPEAAREATDSNVFLLDTGPTLDPLPEAGRIDPRAGAACHGWVLAAAELAGAGRVDGIVTGPIHKEAWARAGVTSPGHTEALRDATGAERVLMLLVGGALRVALATIHVPLAHVPSLLDAETLCADLILLDRETARCFGPARPRLALAGLNPHAGEGGLFGDEEERILAPAVRAARDAGVDVHGPLPADACIPAAAQGGWDAVLAMYHDQALPAVKTLAPRQAVNVTLGLPFVRTSVDHGTAFDVAGRGRATPSSLREAVRLAAQMIRTANASDSGAGALNDPTSPADLP